MRTTIVAMVVALVAVGCSNTALNERVKSAETRALILEKENAALLAEQTRMREDTTTCVKVVAKAQDVEQAAIANASAAWANVRQRAVAAEPGLKAGASDALGTAVQFMRDEANKGSDAAREWLKAHNF